MQVGAGEIEEWDYIYMYIYKIFDLKKRSFGKPKIKVYHKHVQQETPFQHMWLNLKDYFLLIVWRPVIDVHRSNPKTLAISQASG